MIPEIGGGAPTGALAERVIRTWKALSDHSEECGTCAAPVATLRYPPADCTWYAAGPGRHPQAVPRAVPPDHERYEHLCEEGKPLFSVWWDAKQALVVHLNARSAA